jgi:hypothetical protein
VALGEERRLSWSAAIPWDRRVAKSPSKDGRLSTPYGCLAVTIGGLYCAA